jgi:DNA (cytosine-5)-methyltransferase 1
MKVISRFIADPVIKKEINLIYNGQNYKTMDQKEHKFPYEWTLKDANFTKDKGTVFSCFACGGGSTMGYKLAGFDVIGMNEIDPKMAEAYIANHKPKYSFIEPIQTFKTRKDLPKELYNLDILDGSPPCSSFSMAGNREKDWGKEKKFREGQSCQVLDDLFFHFIDLAKELQPKIVVAENVKGLLLGNAKEYVRQIYKEFQKSGYKLRITPYLLDAAKMGIPQRRERIFFIALRKDLASPFMEQIDMFQTAPKLVLNFNEDEITFKDAECKKPTNEKKMYPGMIEFYDYCKMGDSMNTVSPKGKNYWFNYIRINPNKPAPTLAAANNDKIYHYKIPEQLSLEQWKILGSFPLDYDFREDGKLKNDGRYIIGMSVPPVMIAQIATKIHEQWIAKF